MVVSLQEIENGKELYSFYHQYGFFNSVLKETRVVEI